MSVRFDISGSFTHAGGSMRVFSVLVLISASVAQAGLLEMKVIHRELPNLVYQLDCVSGAVHECSREVYAPLWEASFLKTQEDRDALAKWKAARARYSESVDLPLPPGVALPLGRRGDRISLEAQVRMAAMMANSLEDLASRLDLVTLPPDRDAMVGVVRRFEPTFRTWYQGRAKSGDAFALELQKLLTRLDVRNLIQTFQSFYEVPPSSNRALPFLVLDRPVAPGDSRHSFGTQLGGVSLIEVPAGEKATRHLDVAVHELCHFFFFSAKSEAVAKMQAFFVASKAPGAIGTYRLFDEVVATALGNGLIGKAADRTEFTRRFEKPLGFYNDRDIDKAAKALVPFFEAKLMGARISDPEFLDQYVAKLSEAFGDSIASPRLAMFQLLLFRDQRLPFDVDAAVRARFHLNSTSSISGLPEEPEVDGWYAAGTGTALFVVPVAGLAELVKKKLITEAEKKSLSELKGGALLGKPRGNNEWLYVIVPVDQPGLERSLDALAAATRPLEGVQRASGL